MKISNHNIESAVKKPAQFVRVLLHRAQLLAWPRGHQLLEFPGFAVERDTLVRQQTSIKTYHRVRICKNHKTKTSAYAQYGAACSWLAPVKVTVVAKDHEGLCRTELESIARTFKEIRLITVEVAFDFSLSSGIDRPFVLRHGNFGKSRPVGERLFRSLRLGTRHSATMVRAYDKPEIGAYRVEIELHSSWLRKNGLKNPGDVSKLSTLLLPSRLQFVRLDWDSLSTHLSRRKLPAEKLINQARSYAYSIHRALEYLRDDLGLQNVHRFLRPLKINRMIQEALRTWVESWRRESQRKAGGRDE